MLPGKAPSAGEKQTIKKERIYKRFKENETAQMD